MSHNYDRTSATTRTKLIIACLVCALLAGGTLLAIFITTRASRPDFVVGLATWPGFGPGFIAKEKGWFGSLPVEFLVLDDFSARQAAFSSGQTQATVSTLDSFAFESANGVDGRAGLVLDESFGADAIVAKSGIDSAEDLVGKKIAFTRGSPSHFFLLVYLETHGFSLKDVERVEVDDPGRAGEAFVSGDVDAAVTWEPNVTQIVNAGKGKVLASTQSAPGLIVDVMVFAPQALQDRPEDVRTFVDGWLKAVDYIATNRDDAYEIMARHLKIDAGDFPGMAAGLRYADRSRNEEWLVQDGGRKAIELFNSAGKLWDEEGLIRKRMQGEALIIPTFVRSHQ